MEPKKDLFLFVPHTHWEGAVFKTREEYLEMGLPIILRALRLLRMHPHYRFVLDQACYVQPFLERYPEEEAGFRQFLAEGRLEIAGGMDVMPDSNMPGGESFVRQILYGKNYFRQKLGVDVTIGWQLDTFGHHAQTPQLMRLAGYRSFWSQRGVPDLSLPSEFLWEGLDGTQIPFYWLPQGYGVTYFSPSTLPEFSQFMIQRYESLTPNSLGYGRVGLAGADVCLPEEHAPELIPLFNRQADAPFELRIGLPSDYERIVESRKVERPVVKGELNPIFQGTYSSRIEIKQRTRELERLLTTAEKLDALLNSLGEATDSKLLWRAWEPMLFNQTHDLMSGVMTDHVFVDTIRSYDFSARLAQEEVNARMEKLTAKMDTQGEGVPLIVFNSLNWSRTDVVFANAGFSQERVFGLKLIDPDGREVPFQITETDRSERGSLIRVKIAFIARDVPPLGYAVYHLIPLETAQGQETSFGLNENILENEFYRIQVDLATGAILDLWVKQEGWQVLRAPGNVVAQEEDHGDLWEPYRPLNGAQFVTMKERHPAPLPGKAIFSSDQQGEDGKVISGAVYSEFTVSHAFGENGKYQTRIRLYRGLPRVDIQTKILNNDRFVRYRALFPTNIEEGINVQEIPFGAIQRPDGIEYPAQNWSDYGNGSQGLALLNRGIPGNNVADGVMMLSLLRCTEIVAYGIGGGYEGQGSSSGFEIGKENTFDYALVPHGGSWQQAHIPRHGQQHLAESFGLTFFLAREFHPAQLGHTIDNQRDLFVEFIAQLLYRHAAILDGIVQQSAADRDGVQAQVGKEHGHADRMA